MADGKLKVLKNSEAVLKDTDSFKKHHYYHLKEILKDKKRLVEGKGENMFFSDDYVFDSPSAAAAIVLANPSSGPIEWKNKEGKTLKELLEV